MSNTMYILNRTKFMKNGGVKVVEPSVDENPRVIEAKYHRNIGFDLEDATLSGSVSVITDTLGNRIDGYSWGEIIPTTKAE